MTAVKPPYDVWLCDLTHTSQTIASNTFPLAIGLIASYLKKNLGDAVNLRLFKYPEKLIENLLEKQPQVIGFSNYVWNLDLSYSLACKLKLLNKDTVIVFGGPNYPKYRSEQEHFLQKRNLIDFYIYREGEAGLLSLLKMLVKHNFDIELTKQAQLPNCHCLYQGNIVANTSNDRMDLGEIPSPYTTGLLDEFFDGQLMPLLQTNRGCPFSCTFCAESDAFYNKVCFRNPTEVIEELAYIAQRIKGTKNIFIADSNFGMYKQDLLIAAGIAGLKEKYNFPDYIHVATGKNQKERVLEAAKITGGLFRLSASVQSTDPQVLKNIKRQNISQETILELGQTAATIGSNTYAEVILALPGDTKKAHFKSMQDVIDANLNYIRSFTCMLLKGTELDMREIHEVAFQTAKDILMEKHLSEKDIDFDYLAELSKYSLYRKINLLETDHSYEDTFRYDFCSNEHPGEKPGKLRAKRPITLKFFHNPQQKQIIDGHRQEYGTSIIGIGRILSRIHIKKMYRDVAILSRQNNQNLLYPNFKGQ